MLSKFSKIGSKLETEPYGHYLAAKTESDDYLDKNPNNSTVIMRVIYNSEETQNDKWSYKK